LNPLYYVSWVSLATYVMSSFQNVESLLLSLNELPGVFVSNTLSSLEFFAIEVSTVLNPSAASSGG
jgi:hypothetical protein